MLSCSVRALPRERNTSWASCRQSLRDVTQTRASVGGSARASDSTAASSSASVSSSVDKHCTATRPPIFRSLVTCCCFTIIYYYISGSFYSSQQTSLCSSLSGSSSSPVSPGVSKRSDVRASRQRTALRTALKNSSLLSGCEAARELFLWRDLKKKTNNNINITVTFKPLPDLHSSS